MTVRVLGLAAKTTSLEDHRHAIAALLTPAGTMQARSGLFPGVGGDLVSVSAMQAKVTPFYAWIGGTSAALQAGYDFTSDADKTLTFADGEPGVARVDRVVAQVKHNAYDASGATIGDVVVVKGQASGAANPVPPSSLLLWEVTVPAGATAGSGGINFATARADKRQWTVAAGGILPVTGAADIAAALEGRYRDRLDTNVLERDSGSVWEKLADPAIFKAFTPYTPSWTATTNPSIGNGSITARYLQIGKFFAYTGNITMGSTTTFGSGVWQVSLPVGVQNVSLHIGGAWTFHAATGADQPAAAWLLIPVSSPVVRFAIPAGGDVGPTSPHTWAANDQLRWTIIGEAA